MFGVFVVSADEGVDVGFQFLDGPAHAALDLFADQFGEPAFDLVDPTRGCRCEVDMPVRAAPQPDLDRRGLVVASLSTTR